METEQKKRFHVPVSLLFNIVIICLTVFLITYFIFSEGGFIDLVRSGLKVNLFWIVIAVLVHLLNIAIDATIIYLFVRQTTPNFKVKNAITASMVGQFYCAVTPSATGGQPMQIFTMSRMGIKGADATSALVQKFLVWQFTLTVYSIIAVCARFSFFADKLDLHMWIFSAIGFAAQIFMIVVLLLASFAKNLTFKIVSSIFRFLGKLRILKDVDDKIASLKETLDSFHENNQALNKNKPLLIKAYLLTAVQMTGLFLVPYCIAMAFGIPDLNMFDMLCAQAYVNMVSSLVPLPGGSGAAEYCFSTFFKIYFSAETMKSAILIWRTITYYGTIAVSLPFSGLRKKKTLSDQTQSNDNEKGGSIDE